MSSVIEMPTPALPDAKRLPEAQGNRAVMVAGAVAAVGIVLSAVAAMSDSHRFAFSYLTGFAFTATVAAGALFFVILQHLTKAGWSVAARRQMEWIAGAAPVLLILFIPVVLFGSTIYHEWWPNGHALGDELLAKKAAWLNSTGFVIRGVVYIALWSVLGWWFSKTSAKQDETGDPALTVKMQNLSAPTMALFALSISFAGFDWLMSLQPHWYSTIFGVYVFSGSFLAALAVLALLTLTLQKSGLFVRVSTIEHRHDIGKLIFAFTVFWAYIAFSQFMLIWYANLPEETIFYRERWFAGNWSAVSLLLVFGHFAFPFLFLMSRHVKRNPFGLAIGATVVLVMHYVDLYWLVMPTYDKLVAHHSGGAAHGGPDLNILADLGGLLAPAGLLALVAALRAKKSNLYPLKDPRLAETLKVENL